MAARVVSAEVMDGATEAALDAEVEAAVQAGLRYVSDTAPGIRRRRRGRGFSYTMPDGSSVGSRRIDAIRTLAVPPAWRDVWICIDATGHLQATGRDDRKRKQYRYHPTWRQIRDEAKFEQLFEFGSALPALRSAVSADLKRPGMPREKVVALTVGLLDKTLIRVGNDEYRRTNGTYGLTTLESDQVEVAGSELSFCFVGKGGAEHEITLHDPRLARAVRRCHELGGRDLFTYKGDDGAIHRVDSGDCNAYVSGVVGSEVTAKYFRTWGATVTVVEELANASRVADDTAAARESTVVEAIDLAADRLGNTRAVCRRSYVHPGVIDAFETGEITEYWQRSRTSESMSRAERATLRLLDPAQ